MTNSFITLNMDTYMNTVVCSESIIHTQSCCCKYSEHKMCVNPLCKSSLVYPGWRDIPESYSAQVVAFLKNGGIFVICF